MFWKGEREGFPRGHEIFVGDKYVCYLDCADGFMSIHIRLICQLAHFKHVQFIMCQFYLNKAIETNKTNQIP